MPISRKRYPSDWQEIRSHILERAGNRCELCGSRNGGPQWKTKSKVVITVHHIDGNPRHNHKANLIALCQRCHNKLDVYYKIRRRQKKSAGNS